MENEFNKLLLRQIKKHFGSIDNLPNQLKEIIQDINNTYENFEDDIQLLQNSIEISSQEHRDAFLKHKENEDAQREIITKIKKAIYALNPSDHKDIDDNQTASSKSSYLFDSLVKLIEEHNQAEEALKSEKYLMTALMNNIPDHIYFKDSESRFIRINNSMGKLFGITDSVQIVGKTDFDFFSHEHAQQAYEDEQKIILTGLPISLEEKETWTDRPDTWVFTTKIPFRDKNEKIIGTFGISKDITERKQAEEALRQSEFRTKLLTNAAQDAILMMDPKGKISYWNSAAERIFGYSSDEAIGFDLHQLISPQRYHEAHNKAHPEFLLTGQGDAIGKTLDLMALRKDGEEIAIQLSLSSVKIEDSWHAVGIIRDITERKLIENKLKESENLQRSLLENISVGIVIIDPETRIIEQVNTFASILIGDSQTNIIGQKCHQFICPTKEENCPFCNKGLEIANTESVILRNNKPPLAILKTVKRIQIGGREKLLESFVDISVQKEAEEALQQSSKKLEAILSASPDGIGISTLDGKVKYVSDKLAAMYGFPPERKDEIIDQSIFNFTDPSNHAKMKENIGKLLASEGGSKITEYLTVRKDNSRIFADVNSTILFDSKGNPESILFIQRDVTSRKQAEETLNNERALFRTIIDLIPDAVYVKDTQGRKILANPKEVVFTGKIAEDEVIGQTDFNLYPEEAAELALAEDQLVLQTGKPILDIEGTMTDKDGVLHWLLVSKVPLHDIYGQITGLVGVTHDVTEQKKIQAALIEARQEADLGNKAKSEFLANMSHEIRTPLNGVIGFTDLLLKTPLNKIQLQYAENANTSGHSLLGIINDILDFSKIEAGKMELDIIKTDIIELVELASDIIKFHASQKGIELLLNIQSDIPRFVMADSVRLKQILVNLLSNAVKFTESGEVELKVTFVKKDEITGKFHFSVRDTGIGINDEQQKKLFKAFTQADSSTTRKFGGSGLGLTISNMLAEKMGSQIEIISEPGKGSTFFFTIETEYEVGEKLEPGSLVDVKRILVIDDNDNNRMILEHTFNNWGIEFVGIDNGLSALKLIEKSKPFDVIIVDYHMPYLNGIDTIRMIRGQIDPSPENHPVILLHSSSDDIGIYEECKKLGVKFNLTKPVKSQELLHFLRNIHSQPTAVIKDNEYTPLGITAEPVNNFSPVILVAEDVFLNMILVTTIIKQMIPGVIILEAKNGIETLEQTITQNPDLILMDVQMPEMSGIEATIKIREYEKENKKHIPIIALTAGAVKGEKEKCLKAGMEDFLTKPIDQVALYKILEKYLIPIDKRPENSDEKDSIDKVNLHFDKKTFMDNIGNSQPIYDELIELAPKQFSSDLAILEKAISELNFVVIKTAAHSIKGAALNMCFLQLAEIAKKIESSIDNDKNPETLSLVFHDMILEWKQLQLILMNKE